MKKRDSYTGHNNSLSQLLSRDISELFFHNALHYFGKLDLAVNEEQGQLSYRQRLNNPVFDKDYITNPISTENGAAGNISTIGFLTSAGRQVPQFLSRDQHTS